MRKRIFYPIIGALVIYGVAVQAEPVGYVGASIGQSWAENHSDDDNKRAGFGSVNGAIADSISSTGTVVLEAELREDKHSADILDNGDDMKLQYQIGVHYLHDIGENKIGAFVAYNETPHYGGDEDYRTALVGVEGLFTVAPETTLFGQLGYGHAKNDGASSRGFEDGYFVRVGGAYTGFENTILKLEAELAGTEEYEDSHEGGDLKKYNFLGETGINSDNSLAVTYGVSYGTYRASGDDDNVEETMVNLGFRYYFGGTTATKMHNAGIIGLPTLPARATSWVPALD
ncbi:MAG: hypothetical protein COB22_04730 [Cycloclasticus sp.]|nr:MAG: hypothetical protein COB22_04730 [Cycloclasticus sp.]